MIEVDVEIPVGTVVVEGRLTIPHNAHGIVLFAHGSGSSRFSPRNQYVSRQFIAARFGTLLFDLLTAEEEQQDQYTAQYRFDIPLLAQRLIGATHWLKKDSRANKLPFGYFGASTGAAAALIGAAKLPEDVSAVVSRGGRPDLAAEYLPKVQAPTLLIVGGWDAEVIELNQQAQSQMTNENKLEIVPEATHLFEEPGKLEAVAQLSIEWFLKYIK